MSGFITLHTRRLTLRDHRMDDLATHHDLMSDGKVMYYLKNLETKTLEETRDNLLQCIDEINKPERTKFFLRIELQNTRELVGEIGYTVTQITPVGKLVSLGYFTYPRFWNCGYVTEAVKEMIRFAFEENDVYRVSAGCIKDNAGSERVMQKCGMIKEADYREYTWHDGKLKDRVEYRILKNEWLTLSNR